MTALTPINQLFGDLKDGWKQREEIVEFSNIESVAVY